MTELIVPKVTALHPKVVSSLSETITEAKARGLNVGLHMGLRTPEQQDKLYALGRTEKNPDGYDPVNKPMGNIVTNAQNYESWHCLGLAVDIVFKDSKGNWSWDDSHDWDGLGQVGKVFGFSWGGDWSKFPDRPHFQIIGKVLTLKRAKEILFTEGIDKVWSLI